MTASLTILFWLKIMTWYVPVNTLTVRFGGLFPITNMTGFMSQAGIQYMAAFLMAVREINDKSDNVSDNLLPTTVIDIALFDSAGTSLESLYLTKDSDEELISSMNAAVQVATSFQGRGVHGCVGPASNIQAQGVTPIFNTYKISYVTYASTASYLSYVQPYPYYIRTAFSDAFQSIAIADVIYNYFRWTKVVVFSTSDSYGGDSAFEFKTAASTLGITVMSAFEFRPGVRDLSSEIDLAKTLGARIFVLLMSSEDAGRLMEQGHQAGLFREGTQILAGSYVSVKDTWSGMTAQADVDSIMKGFIGVVPYFGLDTPLGRAFVKRWRAQNSTIGQLPDGSQYCDGSKDDNGNYLYRNRGVKGLCAGLDFKTFAEDGSDITDYAPYAYDATYLLAHALHHLIYDLNVTDINGDNVGNAIVSNGSFVGVTGPVNTLNGDPSTGYRYGDRQAGAKYTVLNYRSRSSGLDRRLVSVGSWTQSGGLVLCSDPSCAIVFNTVDNSVPLDSPPAILSLMSSELKGILYAMSGLCLALVSGFTCMVLLFRKKRIMKAGQPSMMLVVLIGGFVACGKIINTAMDVSDVRCQVGTWLGHLSFCMVFTALLSKTWRVHLVVNSAFKRVKITASVMIQMVVCISFMFCGYLSLFTMVGNPHKAYRSTYDTMQQETRYFFCACSQNAVATTLYVIEGAVLVQGVRLCWLTRNIPDAVNESKYIAMGRELGICIFVPADNLCYLSLIP